MGTVLIGSVNMKVFALLALVAVVTTKNVDIRLDALEYGFCDGSPEPASIDEFTVEPFPIIFATNNTITLKVRLTLNEPIPAGSTLKLNIKKEGFINIPIPCIEIQGTPIGSCTYDGDDVLAAVAAGLCPTYVPDGQECALPLGPGLYGGEPDLVIVLPEIPPELGIIIGNKAVLYADATIT